MLLVSKLATYRFLTVSTRRMHQYFTTDSARKILGIDHENCMSPKELRLVYLKAVKRCHPDTATASHLSKAEVLSQFRNVFDAYEFLQGKISELADLGITATEEANYRAACHNWLGLSADIVEESKRCPMFRNWLKGETDSAESWRMFFSLHGGLAPMLRAPVALIADHTIPQKSTTRRKRR